MLRQHRIAAYIIILLLPGITSAQDENQVNADSKQNERPYHLVMSWGKKGINNGEFNGPTGIGVSFSEVYVSDNGNSRIQVFDFSGKFLGIIGQSDSYHTSRRLGQMSEPMNIDFENNEVYVADAGLHRILIYSPEGQFHREIGLEGKGQAEFKSPTGLAAIIDRSETSTHAQHDKSQGGSFDVSHLRGDRIIIADTLNNRVQNLRSFGRFLTFMGNEPADNLNADGDKFDGQFNRPSDVAVDQNSNIYITDGKNNRIIVFKQNGEYSHQWSIPNQENTKTDKGLFTRLLDTFKSKLFGLKQKDWFSPIMSIAAGPDNNIFVADFYKGNIYKFNQDGLLLNQFGISDTDDVRFTYSGVDVAYDGTVFVSDYKNQQVHVWRPEGWTAKNPKEITNKAFKIFHTDSGHASHH